MRYNLRGAWLAFVLLLGCGQPRPVAEQGAVTERVDNLITQAEIEQSRSATVYDAISKLRGNFLTNRGKTTILGSAQALPVVYVDGILYGPFEALKSMSATSVGTIRLYRAWEAAKFGPDKTGGVIEITSRRK